MYVDFQKGVMRANLDWAVTRVGDFELPPTTTNVEWDLCVEAGDGSGELDAWDGV